MLHEDAINELQDGELCVGKKVSPPVFQVVSKQEKGNPQNFWHHLKRNRRKTKVKKPGRMEMKTEVEVHRSAGRKGQSHSKHEHKCRNTKHKSTEKSLQETENSFALRNYLSGKKACSALSVDSGLSRTEVLSPFKMNVAAAYRHLKTENGKLKNDIEKLMDENEEIKSKSSEERRENENLREDVSLMKNLVYKLNMELERYQNGDKKTAAEGEEPKSKKLPKNYEKNFLRPILPLLKAYAETMGEKDEIIANLESEYKKFNASFNDLLQENEKLYAELERKFTSFDGGVSDQVKLLKKDLEMAQQENNLLFQQIKLEKEKLVKVHSVFKIKVEELYQEKEDIAKNMEEIKTELYLFKGKYAVLKQEFESLKIERDARVPLAVHSASINECRQLFHDLKNGYENEKQKLSVKIKEQNGVLTRMSKQEEKWIEEKSHLEKSNFNQTFEIESLKKKIFELENALEGGGQSRINDGNRAELLDTRKQLRESNKRTETLKGKLSATKKQLQKALLFAEDIVKGQESLLLQLHAKQKENNYMTTQFGSLKNQLKDVERGAQKDLNSIEEKIKSLEAENYALAVHNRKLEKVLAEKEEMIKRLEPTKDSLSSGFLP